MQGTNIGNVTTTISAAATDARSLDADAIVIGVIEGADGPQPAPGAEHLTAALGDDLASVLAVLGATGKGEEVTKLPTAAMAIGSGQAKRYGARPEPRSARWQAAHAALAVGVAVARSPTGRSGSVWRFRPAKARRSPT